ncbi:unnamed protein product [Symbiodinium sp. CCMP2592]|nr:unnamed protein product [Symbiodinium sp. CCMP2592]
MTMVEKVLVVVTFVISLVVNGLSASGVFGQSIGAISDQYPTYVTPDGLTFLIWSVIYTLELILVIAQCFPTESAEKLLQQSCCLTTTTVRVRLIIAFLLNALWLPFYVNLYWGKALLVIVVYLIFLLLAYIDVNTTTTTSFWEWVLYGAGIACNISWVIVATAANKFTLLGSFGWEDVYGVAGTPWAAVLVVAVVASVAVMIGTMRSDFAWSITACWALAGLHRQHTISDPSSFPPEAMNKTLALCALWAAIVVGVATVTGLFLIPYNGVFKSKGREIEHKPLIVG